jgi:hypothetical protein
VRNGSTLCTLTCDTIASLLLGAQVSDTGAVYTAPLMAELLFGGVPDAALCAAAHALLSADRTYFKQTARLPPAFQPRSAAAVAAICAEQAAALQVRPVVNRRWNASMQPVNIAQAHLHKALCPQVAAKRSTDSKLTVESADLMQRQKERAVFVGAIAGVPDSSTGRQPTRADWLNGLHAPTLSAIEALALTTAGTSAAAQVSQEAPVDCFVFQQIPLHGSFLARTP